MKTKFFEEEAVGVGFLPHHSNEIESDSVTLEDQPGYIDVALNAAKAVGLVLVIFLSLLAVCSLTYSFYGSVGYHVDKTSCTCDCFDRQLKGHYFNTKDQYRYIYVNYELASLVILFWTGWYGWCLAKLVSKAAILIWEKRLRWWVLVGILFNLPGPYYNWGATWNYLNDRIYHLFGTQMFFNITEWFITLPLYYLLATKSTLPIAIITFAQATALCHCIASLEDQGFYHMVLHPKESRIDLVLRDLIILLSDAVPLVVLLLYSRLPRWRRALVLLGETAFLYGIYATLRKIYPYSYN